MELLRTTSSLCVIELVPCAPYILIFLSVLTHLCVKRKPTNVTNNSLFNSNNAFSSHSGSPAVVPVEDDTSEEAER